MNRKKIFFLLPCIFLAQTCLFGQLYTNASDNLPANGASGQSMDVRAADLDKDGDLDIVLANEFQGNTILINDGNATFTNATSGNLPQRIQDSEDVAIADFNMDGHLDLVFCSEDDVDLGESNVHEYYLGDGTGQFSTAPTQLPDSKSNAAITAFINNDTFPDLIFGNDGQNFVLINDGNGQFSNETSSRLPNINDTTQDLMFFDVDNDGDDDLMVGNENGNKLLINDGQGVFSDESTDRLPPSFNLETRKIAFGDIDGDEDEDIFLANVAFIPGKNPQNRLWKNDGNGYFTDVTSSQLPFDADFSIDAIFVDINFDSDLDLIIGNVFNNTPIRVYANDGTGSFQDSTLQTFGTNYIRDALGVIAADLNGDQSLDLYICDRNTGTGNKDLLLLNNQEVVSSITSESIWDEATLLYPNPGKDYFQIDLPKEVGEVKSLQIVDAQGKVLKQLKYQLNNRSIVFKIADHRAKGIYFVQIHSSKGLINKKLILE
jgi:hypothetical protein